MNTANTLYKQTENY